MQFTKVSVGAAVLFLTFRIFAASGEAVSSGSNSQADREWAKRTSKINVYETKVKDLTKTLQTLIIQKNGTHSAGKANGAGGSGENAEQGHSNILDRIAETHKELKETVVTYNKEKAELKYRFPEEGMLIERRYVPLREQSLEQIENEIGLDAELTKTKMKIDRKYASFIKDITPAPTKPKRAESTLKVIKPKAGQKEERLKLSQ